MMTNSQPETSERENHRRRLARLEADRRNILTLPPEQAGNAILDHPQATALVHSFAEEDFFFLIHDIGPTDALELLAMASARQWEYILDMEIWHRDQIDLKSVTHWFNLLMKAAPSRFIHWSLQEKPDLMEYYLNQTVELCIRAHDQEPSELDGDYFTFDDIFYVRLTETPAQRESEPEHLEQQQSFVADMLNRLAMTDHVRYQEILLRSVNVLPAESEEEAYRFRNVRLAEKGFLPFDEAVGVYQPISVRVIQQRKKELANPPQPDLFFPAPLNHLAFLETDNRFTRALSLISLEDTLKTIQVEFAGLCNQIASADQKPIHERSELRHVVKKACGYLEIGLERLAGKKSRLDDSRTAAFIQTYPLIDIFRLGYGLLTKLSQRAKQWEQQSWFANNRLALSFWDEYLVGMIGGLLLKRPRFFDNFETEGLYRDFASLSDVKTAHAALKQAMAFDDLLSCMDIDAADLPEGFFVTYKNLLLTLWARHELNFDRRARPIALDSFKPFYRALWQRSSEAPRIRSSMKSNFLAWLSEESAFTREEISLNLGNALENLFDELAWVYGEVTDENLDPRFVPHFFLNP